MPMRRHWQALLILGFTAVFVGYLSVWLVGPGAGLSFLGIELGEWLKFIGLGPSRDYFYLPPVTLSAALILWTTTWVERGWRAWAVRGLALLVSLLAFPAIEDISGPVREQYTTRVLWIGAVAALALLSAFWGEGRGWQRLAWLLIVVVSSVGLVLPLWQMAQVRPYLAELVGQPFAPGMGLWLAGFGYGLVILVSLWQLLATRHTASRE